MYPKFKNKHLEKALFNPKDYLNYTKCHDENLPKKYLIMYYDLPFKYLKKKYNIKKIKELDDYIFEVFKYKDIGIIKIRGIGSPNAVIVMEELIALGGKNFLNIGTAGGLKKRGIFLSTKSLRDEGTSYHYVSKGQFSYPNKELTKELANYLKKHKIEFEEGVNWTIDACYRETKTEILHYKKQGISTVDMEASALFALAKYRKVKIASAFIVSDTLLDKREKFYDKQDFKNSFYKLLDAAVECLIKIP